MKLSNKELVQDTLWILAGNIALAMGVAWFILPNDVLTGGLAGVAIALEPLIHLNPEYTHIPLPTLVLVVDALTVLLGAAVYGLQAALTGILSVWVSSYMINKTMMIGGHDARNVMIVSNKHKEIMDRIHEVLERGTTILEATGGYSSEKRPVIMAVVTKKQLPELEHLVSHIDPEAFVIVMEANEVQGLGFTYEEEL